MKYVKEILGGIGILIGIYLVLSHGEGAITLLDSLTKSAVKGVATLYNG